MDLGGSARVRARGRLDDQHGSALTRDVPAGGGIERQVRPSGVRLDADPPASELGEEPQGSSAESTPPVIMRSVPPLMVRQACPSASSPPACSATRAALDPRSPLRMEICPLFTA
ncbi:hypothetical protein Jiend_53180 [Micromonospora endophytica]|nr:hypothetical protein Jiend_53180 [Micromonospora endophytica]